MVERSKLHVKKGDTVVVLAGKEKGRSGKVLSVNTKKERVFVEKINMIKRHSRPSKHAPQGGIIEKEASPACVEREYTLPQVQQGSPYKETSARRRQKSSRMC